MGEPGGPVTPSPVRAELIDFTIERQRHRRFVGRTVATLEGHANWVRACAVTSDGRRVVSASDDRTLKVWDLDSGRAVATLEGHAARVNACAVTPDGRRVVSASADKTLKVWELETGRAVATLEGHTARVLACAVDSHTCCLTPPAHSGSWTGHRQIAARARAAAVTVTITNATTLRITSRPRRGCQ